MSYRVETTPTVQHFQVAASNSASLTATTIQSLGSLIARQGRPLRILVIGRIHCNGIVPTRFKGVVVGLESSRAKLVVIGINSGGKRLDILSARCTVLQCYCTGTASYCAINVPTVMSTTSRYSARTYYYTVELIVLRIVNE